VSKRLTAFFVAALLGGGVVAACGSDSGGGGGGGGSISSGGGNSEAKIEGAKVIDPASMNNAKGSVTLCMGKDTSGDKTALVKKFTPKLQLGIELTGALERNLGRDSESWCTAR